VYDEELTSLRRLPGYFSPGRKTAQGSEKPQPQLTLGFSWSHPVLGVHEGEEVAGKQSGSSKKPQSERKKMDRARSRRNAKQRHEANAQQQELRQRHNLRLAKDGELTPWAQACAARAYRRSITCGRDHALFGEDGRCTECGGTVSLKAAWEKRAA
jgi:hypothetical protein